MPQARAGFSDDDVLYVEWGGVTLSFDGEGFGYAVRTRGTRWEPGEHKSWPEAVQEIKAAIAADSKD